MELISIIIPSFNLSVFITETLDSIVQQSYQDWECMVVDDGSTDNTMALLKTYAEKDPRFKVFKRPSKLKKGPNSCRNLGFEKSNGRWILFMDGDDLLQPNALLTMIQSLKHHTDVLVSPLIFYHPNNPEKDKQNRVYSQEVIKDYLVGEVSFYVCGGLWHRPFLEKRTPLFDPVIRNLDDWDFNLRMLYHNPSIQFLKVPSVKYRIHKDSLSHQIENLQKKEIESELYAREKHLTILEGNNSPAHQILKDFILQRKQYFFKNAMLQRHPQRFYFFKLLLVEKIKQGKLLGAIHTITIFKWFFLFHKGYKYLR